jgi:hypothetical protein
VVQVVEHLLCKCKALSSNPNPAQKITLKKKKKVHESMNFVSIMVVS